MPIRPHCYKYEVEIFWSVNSLTDVKSEVNGSNSHSTVDKF